MIFMVVGNAYGFSWWLATHMIFHGGWHGDAYDFSLWFATSVIFHGGWQRV